MRTPASRCNCVPGVIPLVLAATLVPAFVSRSYRTPEQKRAGRWPADWKAELMQEVPKRWAEYRAKAKELQGSIKIEGTHKLPALHRSERTDQIRQLGPAALCLMGTHIHVEGAPFPW